MNLPFNPHNSRLELNTTYYALYAHVGNQDCKDKNNLYFDALIICFLFDKIKSSKIKILEF